MYEALSLNVRLDQSGNALFAASIAALTSSDVDDGTENYSKPRLLTAESAGQVEDLRGRGRPRSGRFRDKDVRNRDVLRTPAINHLFNG